MYNIFVCTKFKIKRLSATVQRIATPQFLCFFSIRIVFIQILNTSEGSNSLLRVLQYYTLKQHSIAHEIL